MADIWEAFGVNALDVWDLPANTFFTMTQHIDQMRREAKKKK